MRLKGRLAIPALVLVIWGCGSVWAAQETDEAPDAQGAASEESPGKLDWLRFYVSVARGEADGDPVNSSVATSQGRVAENGFTNNGQVYTRAALGYQLKKGKGDFRLVFNGFKEDGYRFTAIGFEDRLEDGSDAPPCPEVQGNQSPCKLPWWTIEVNTGDLRSQLFPPQWSSGLVDLDSDGIVDIGDFDSDGMEDLDEIFYLNDPEIDVARTITDDLQNRVQTVDFLYGRTFGKRRFSGHWWAGVRWSVYEGNIPAAAWLKDPGLPGEGFTDGAFLKFINFHQQFDGGGGTGAIEFDFNFFNDRLTLFTGGEFAFIFGNLETDSGKFGTLIAADSPVTLTVPARLTATRRKTTWQTGADLGAKVRVKDGLDVELAWYIRGYLDVILLPTEILIPEGELDADQGSSALYNTQDLVNDGWRVGVNFQF